jgi:cysteine desulfurase
VIYLDHNATTPLNPRALDAMLPFLGDQFGNPSSLSRLGRTARTAIDTAREQVAAMVGVSASQVVFTSGGTEANNLAIIGLSRDCETGTIATSSIEHPSVLSPVFDYLGTNGWNTQQLPVDHSGQIDANTIDTLCAKNLRLVSVMLANNETGVLQDVCHIADHCQSRNILLHTDAVQALGKIPVDFNALNVDCMSLSAHKIYGPKGVGALIIDPSINMQALLYGGGQEKKLRPGTENVAGIVGFGVAAELATQSLHSHLLTQTTLRDQLIKRLHELDKCTIFGETAPRLPNTVQFAINGVDGEMLLMALDCAGIAVSSGSACASGSQSPSHVLQAMGIDELAARGAIRISFGSASTTDNIESLMAVIKAQLSSWNFDDN